MSDDPAKHYPAVRFKVIPLHLLIGKLITPTKHTKLFSLDFLAFFFALCTLIGFFQQITGGESGRRQEKEGEGEEHMEEEEGVGVEEGGRREGMIQSWRTGRTRMRSKGTRPSWRTRRKTRRVRSTKPATMAR